MAARDGVTVDEYRAGIEAAGKQLPSFAVSFVPDPRVGEMQIALMQANYQAFMAQLEEARSKLSSRFERVIAALDQPPFDLDGLHAAIEAGDARMLLHLSARSAFVDANTGHTQMAIMLSRVLRGTLEALASAEAGDTKHLKAIVKAAEPKPRDMHATERSDMRVQTLERMHAVLFEGLAKRWGAINVDDLIARKQEIASQVGLPRENAERAAREDMAAFSSDRAPELLARVFIDGVALIPEVFIERGIPFTTEERYTEDGAIDGRPDPKRLEAVSTAYKQRIDNWESTRDDETIVERAVDLIEEGLVALKMDRKRGADAVVSFLRKRKDRATQKDARANGGEREPEDSQP